MNRSHRRFLLHASPWLLLALGACGGSGETGEAQVADMPQHTAGAMPRALAATTSLLPFTTNDPLRTQQWHLHNTGSVLNSVAGIDLNLGHLHQTLRGEGVRVAVVDGSVDVLHEDLRANLVPGASHNYLPDALPGSLPLPAGMAQAPDASAMTAVTNVQETAAAQRKTDAPDAAGIQGRTNGAPITDEHGTSVAGILAARDDNGLGGVGVAPRVSLVAYNALAHRTDQSLLDALTRGLDANDIYSNSWGAPDSGHFEHPSAGDGALSATLQHGLRTGRAGKGAIYVFASGNGAQTGDYSVYDSNVSHRGTITVCAVNAGGKRTVYSEAGPNLTVCAPSGDLLARYENWQAGITTLTPGNGYRHNFNGTSATVPMVSGVVALMLQANPALTWRDVPLILARTARQVDAASPGWRSLPETQLSHQMSGAGNDALHFHHHYGFGLVDAQAAVQQARHWNSVGGSENLRQCGPYRQKVRRALPERTVWPAGALLPVPGSAVARAMSADTANGGEGIDNPIGTHDTSSTGGSGTNSSDSHGAQHADPHVDYSAHGTVPDGWMIDENQPVQDGLLAGIDIPADCPIRHIEHVDVRMTAVSDNYLRRHPAPGDLHITLTSPLGQVSTLAMPHACGQADGQEGLQESRCVGLKDFRFGVRRHLEEPAATDGSRRWTLGMADRRAGGHGKLQWWEITLYGRE